jgi:methionyl-tRNA synthetase
VRSRFYVTTPIFYVNDAPHLGTAYTMVVADVLARWRRARGDEVHFLTGTDEHGLKIARAAAEAGLSPKEWVDRTSERFRAAWRALGISHDDFIRTTDDRHARAVARFVTAIRDNGYLRKGTYEGWYCVACEAYYADAELGEGRLCPVHARPVEWLAEENWFFELSRFEERLLEWYERHPDAVRPESRRNEALGFIRGGLQDISVSRSSLEWGVPLPFDPDQVAYVWFDALVNYVSAIGYGEDAGLFEAWWPAVHHLLGKDILRFHAVWWPAMCMAAGIEPPAHLFVHGWLLAGGEKMAKSRANQVDPVALADEVGVEALRYYLLREVTLGADGDFSYEGLLARYNSDLANNLGNLLARVAAVVATKCGGLGPPPRPAERAGALAEAAAKQVAAASAAFDAFAPHEALEAVMRLVHDANSALEAAEPWRRPPGPEVDGVLGDALEVLRLSAVLVAPAMPAAAAEIWRRIGVEGRPDAPGAAGDGLRWGGYPGGVPVQRVGPLFPRR